MMPVPTSKPPFQLLLGLLFFAPLVILCHLLSPVFNFSVIQGCTNSGQQVALAPRSIESLFTPAVIFRHSLNTIISVFT